MFSEEDYIMWLTRIKGIGPAKIKSMIDYFESAENIWFASSSTLRKVSALNENNIQSIISAKDEKIINSYIDELKREDIKFIALNNKNFPYLLKNIPEPPIGIYVKGVLPSDDTAKVSIIGARRCSEYGASNAYKIAKELACNNIIVVSGMADGIDSMAHRGAIDGNGITIAVLGNGVDICYPSGNKSLRDKILKSGCIISEYPPKTLPYAAHFPARNRIISGLSKAVAVIESEKRSGTLITVGQALEQGRDVFAMPGNINSKLSEGTNELLKQGAYVLTETNDILNILGIENKKNNKNISSSEKNISLAYNEKLVYDCISLEPITLDEIIVKTNLKIQSIQYILTVLELNGYIQRLSGQKYIRSL